MKLTAEKVGTSLEVRIEGELDMANADQLRDSIDEYLETYETIRDVCLNCEAVPFIDSSGLAVLLGRYRKLEARKGKLFILQPTPQVQRVLKLSGLDKLVVIRESAAPNGHEIGGVANGCS